MPPKGSTKRAAASKKKAAAAKKPAVPKKAKKVKFADMKINPSAVLPLDDNGFVVGSKEANWALLQKKGNWFTFLDDDDVKDAEMNGVIPGSNAWVDSKTPQLAPRQLSNTRKLSSIAWEFPDPWMIDHTEEAGPPPKRRRGRAAATAADPILDIDEYLRISPERSALPTNNPAADSDELLGRGRRKATNRVLAVPLAAPPVAPVDADRKIATPKGRGRQKAINKAPSPLPPPPPAAPVLSVSSASSALSSLASRTPSPPPEFLKMMKISPAPSSSSKRPSPSLAEEEEEAAPPAKRTRRAVSSAAVSTGSTIPGRKAARGEFPCEKCSKSFGRVEHLERHVKSVHDKVKEHECEGCKAKFSRKDNMKQHQRKCEMFLALGEEDE